MSTWVKVYNSMPAHPKFLMAGGLASWMFVCGLCYSNEHLTDGFIACHALPVVAPGVKAPEKLAAELVAAGLWHAEPNGWRIHDYATVQRSSDTIRDDRARDAARKAHVRTLSNGSPRGQIADSEESPDENFVGVRPVRVEESRGEKRKDNNSTVERRSTASDLFAYWQQQCHHPTAKLTAGRRRCIEARQREGYTDEQIRHGIDGAARAPFVNDAGERFDDIELICRNGSRLESFIGRRNAKPSPRSDGISELDRQRLELMNAERVNKKGAA